MSSIITTMAVIASVMAMLLVWDDHVMGDVMVLLHDPARVQLLGVVVSVEASVVEALGVRVAVLVLLLLLALVVVTVVVIVAAQLLEALLAWKPMGRVAPPRVNKVDRVAIFDLEQASSVKAAYLGTRESGREANIPQAWPENPAWQARA